MSTIESFPSCVSLKSADGFSSESICCFTSASTTDNFLSCVSLKSAAGNKSQVYNI